MKEQEFLKITGMIRTSYPGSNVLPTTESINTWYEMLKDLDFSTCFQSVNEYIKNNEYPPSIASIRKGCTKKVNAFADTWDIAWDKVMTAVRKYGTYGAKEAMESLDELTRKSVKAIGFYEICTSNTTNFLRREFKEIYVQNKEDYDFSVQSHNDIRGIEGKVKRIG